ncbi:MAG: hypothetical protein D6693_06435, partial [Planctomycetota bacterium]
MSTKQKRVFEIARELGVKSRAILDKCKAEGVPNMNNHMSSVSAGLEATIREWFSASGGGTAVETTEHVDLEKVRAAPRKRARAKARKASTSDTAGGEAATAVAEPPAAPPAAEQPAPAPAPEEP